MTKEPLRIRTVVLLVLWVATHVDGADVRHTDRSDLECIVALILDGCPLRSDFFGRRLEDIMMILSC